MARERSPLAETVGGMPEPWKAVWVDALRPYDVYRERAFCLLYGL